MKNNPSRVLGIYIRVSDPKQVAKGISLHDQELRGIKQAREIGWSYEVFKDAGLTGTLKSTDRPALNELIEKILADEIHGMYYVEIDRMSRNVTDGNILLSMLIDKRVRLFDYTGEVNIQDESVEDMTRIKLIFSNSVVRGIRRKVKRVLDTNIEEGKVTGGMLKYGYKKGEDKMMLIDEEEAKIVNLNPLIAVWLPNFVFGLVAFYLYKRQLK